MISFGMPTLIEFPNLEDCASLAYELGLQFIELNMNLPQYQPQTLDVSRLAHIADRYDIFYTLHLDENLNVADFNPYIAQGYLKTVLDSIRLAKKLRIKVLNMHLSRGVHFTLPERKVFLFDVYREAYQNSICAFRDTCEREVGNCDIQLCVENCSGYTDFQRDAIDFLLQSPVFGLTFDVGHHFCAGGVDELFIRSHIDRLRHIHLHDAAGGHDHLALGSGEVDVPSVLDLSRTYRCTTVLETKTIAALRASATYLNGSFFDHDLKRLEEYNHDKGHHLYPRTDP